MSWSNIVYMEPPHVGDLSLGGVTVTSGVYQVEWKSPQGDGCIRVDEAVWAATVPDLVTMFETVKRGDEKKHLLALGTGVPFVIVRIDPRHKSSTSALVSVAPYLRPGKPERGKYGKQQRSYPVVPLHFSGEQVLFRKAVPQAQAYRPLSGQREFPLAYGDALQLSKQRDSRYVLDVLCVGDPAWAGVEMEEWGEMEHPACWSLVEDLEATGPDFFRFKEGREPPAGSLLWVLYAVNP